MKIPVTPRSLRVRIYAVVSTSFTMGDGIIGFNPLLLYGVMFYNKTNTNKPCSIISNYLFCLFYWKRQSMEGIAPR